VQWAFAPADPSQGIVYALLPRDTLLSRLVANGATEPVVANLTQLVAVTAPRPAPDWFVVDRYLAAAAWTGIDALIAFNKVDLAASDRQSSAAVAAMEDELAVYAGIGYRIVRTSAHVPGGTSSLKAELLGATSVLVGQSGTGKSSLLNALVPDAQVLTQEISRATDEGRHTTTASVLHRLAGGGALIDSPGVRDYAPPLPTVREVAWGFVEIAALAGSCRFQDCLHLSEPGCAVHVARSAGQLHPRRYESYRRLLALTREHTTKRSHAKR
jgi:ribosome biogenesis GTPase